MLQQLWRCFETTGDINMYLGFKEYELEYSRRLSNLEDSAHADEVG